MSAPRKTVKVADLTDRINRMLAAPGGDAAGRVALSVLLESVLMDTGNYRGYGYQSTEYLPASEQTDDRVLRDGYDDTRRRYFNPPTGRRVVRPDTDDGVSGQDRKHYTDDQDRESYTVTT